MLLSVPATPVPSVILCDHHHVLASLAVWASQPAGHHTSFAGCLAKNQGDVEISAAFSGRQILTDAKASPSGELLKHLCPRETLSQNPSLSFGYYILAQCTI